MHPRLPFASSSRRMTTGDTGLHFRSEGREMRLVSRLSGCSFYVTRCATARMRGRGIPLRVTTQAVGSMLQCPWKQDVGRQGAAMNRGMIFFCASMWTCSLESMSLCGGRWSWASKAPPSPAGRVSCYNSWLTACLCQSFDSVWMQLRREGKMCKQNGTACMHTSVCLALRTCRLYILTLCQ